VVEVVEIVEPPAPVKIYSYGARSQTITKTKDASRPPAENCVKNKARPAEIESQKSARPVEDSDVNGNR